MMEAAYWIEKLGLEAHPEGGYYKETYRNPATLQVVDGTGGKRNLATSIYFLLKENQKSHFHQLRSDELWYFHSGAGVEVHILEGGKYRKEVLGLDIENGEWPQIILPAQSIFAAQVIDPKGYALMGCMVNPGFDFKDFRMVSAEELVGDYPEQKKLIEQFAID